MVKNKSKIKKGKDKTKYKGKIKKEKKSNQVKQNISRKSRKLKKIMNISARSAKSLKKEEILDNIPGETDSKDDYQVFSTTKLTEKRRKTWNKRRNKRKLDDLKRARDKDTIRLEVNTNITFNPINLNNIKAVSKKENQFMKRPHFGSVDQRIQYHFIPEFMGIPLDNIEAIASGSYGSVLKYTDSSGKYSIAVKKFKRSGDDIDEAKIVNNLAILNKQWTDKDRRNAEISGINDSSIGIGVGATLRGRLQPRGTHWANLREESDDAPSEKEIISLLNDCSMINARVVYYDLYESKLVSIDEYDQKNHKIYILMDSMDTALPLDTDLLIEALGSYITKERLINLNLKIIQIIAKNVKCLADKKYYYTDIKAENIMAKLYEDKLKIYFGDLGSIYDANNDSSFRKKITTYPAPEEINLDNACGCIVWSIGATLIRLLRPFRFILTCPKGLHAGDVKKYGQGRSAMDIEIPKGISAGEKFNFFPFHGGTGEEAEKAIKIKEIIDRIMDQLHFYEMSAIQEKPNGTELIYEKLNKELKKLKKEFESFGGIYDKDKEEYTLWDLLNRFFAIPEERITLEEIIELDFNIF